MDFERDKMNGKFLESKYRVMLMIKPEDSRWWFVVGRATSVKVLEYRHDPTLIRMEISCNPEIGLADIRYCTAAFRFVY